VCFIFPDYENDLQRLVDLVLPRMKHRHTETRRLAQA
jgi:hypothetical protein